MKLLLITSLALGACAYQPPTCIEPAVDVPEFLIFTEDGPVILTKEGFPIIVELPLSAPCPTVTPPRTPQPPADDPPVSRPAKGNNGWGNGDQDAPSGSEPNNGAENKGGNHNGRDEAPSSSWHDK